MKPVAYIYLVKDGVYSDSSNIYKIGKTIQTDGDCRRLSRLQKYSIGTSLHYTAAVPEEYVSTIEGEIKEKFGSLFKRVRGREWFEGSVYSMRKEMNRIIEKYMDIYEEQVATKMQEQNVSITRKEYEELLNKIRQLEQDRSGGNVPHHVIEPNDGAVVPDEPSSEADDGQIEDPLKAFLTYICKLHGNKASIDYTGRDLLNTYHGFLKEEMKLDDEDVSKWNQTLFGVRLKQYCTKEVGITKRVNVGVKKVSCYTFNIDKVRTYMCGC